MGVEVGVEVGENTLGAQVEDDIVGFKLVGVCVGCTVGCVVGSAEGEVVGSALCSAVGEIVGAGLGHRARPR